MPETPESDAPTEPEKAKAAPKAPKHTYVSVKWPTDFFESGVDDLVISQTPQQIPAASLPALREAASASGVNLIEEKS